MIPATRAAFENTLYEFACVKENGGLEIDHTFFDQLISEGGIDVIDIREPGELPGIDEFVHHKIPLLHLEKEAASLQSGTIVLVCQTGKRSVQAGRQLSAIFGTAKKIYSLRGGIVHWKSFHKPVLQ
jgi:adenylyltransferase/sulfurtransferase